MQGDELVVAADGVLLDGVDLGTDDKVEVVLLAVGGEVELAVLVGLAGRRVRVLGGVVEGVGVGHLELLALALDDDLVGKVVVDVGSLLGESAGHVEAVLGAVRGVHGGVGGVLVDSDHVERGVITLVEEDLVALHRDDNVPGVDGPRGTHEHGEDAVGGEDGGLVLVGELLDHRIGRSRNIVRSAVNGVELALETLDGGLVVGAVVVVDEAVGVNLLALVGIQVELGEAVVVNLLEQLPVGLDVNTGVTVAGGLVVVLPAEAAATTATASSAPFEASSVASTAALLAATGDGRSATTSVLSGTSTLAAAAGEDGATAESCLGAVAGVADDGEGGLVLGGRGVEGDGVAGTVDLLVLKGGKRVSDDVVFVEGFVAEARGR